MVDKNQILLMYYRDGANKSFISAKLGISRKTVRKYISEHESLYGKDFSIKSLEAGLTSKPSYDTSSREKIKLSRGIEEEIKYCLEENQKKRNSGLGKQQQKKTDIYQYLIEKGYKIGYTTVCNYIRKQEIIERRFLLIIICKYTHHCFAKIFQQFFEILNHHHT